MAINPVQPNIENTKSHIPYREAKGTIKTDKNVKPLPPEGHLVHDSWTMLPKYFLKDIAYDMKAVKDGFQGNANDHQLGRLNDVGLKLGGMADTYWGKNKGRSMEGALEKTTKILAVVFFIAALVLNLKWFN